MSKKKGLLAVAMLALASTVAYIVKVNRRLTAQ